MVRSIAKKIKNIIWYSSYYDFESNCIVRNRRIDLIDWDSIKETLKNILFFIACIVMAVFFPYIMFFLILVTIRH